MAPSAGIEPATSGLKNQRPETNRVFDGKSVEPIGGMTAPGLPITKRALDQSSYIGSEDSCGA